MQIKKEQRLVFIILVACIALPVLLSVATDMADRGSIISYQFKAGRFKILADIFVNNSLSETVFGHGIGAGSNTESVILNNLDSDVNYNYLDGFFNLMIYQYGLMGLFIALTLVGFVFRKLNDAENTIVKYVFFGTVILQAFTHNVIETHAFLLVVGIVFVMVTCNKFKTKDNLKECIID
jgi:hypothetical protein